MAEKSISEMEKSAATVASQALADQLKAAVDILNLATKVQANDVPAEKLTKAGRVKLLLLQRIRNDLRCCMILVERGYPLQAVSLAAGIYEAWVTIANIETEEDAVKWLSHDKEDKSFGRIRALAKQAVKKMTGDANANEADKMYSQYQQLCMAKHLNPILERNRGYVLDGDVVEFRPGPDTSKLAIKWSSIALQSASQFAYFALLSIVDDSQDTLRAEFIAQRKQLNEIRDKFVQRWPDNCPSRG